MTDPEDPRCKGRHPEFARMSLKPGIGANFMHEVASTLLEHRLDTLQDVPTVISSASFGSSILGRYLSKKLRTYVGHSEDVPQETLQKIYQEMQHLREIAKENSPDGKGYSDALKTLILEENEGKYRQLEARTNRFKKRETLETR